MYIYIYTHMYICIYNMPYPGGNLDALTSRSLYNAVYLVNFSSRVPVFTSVFPVERQTNPVFLNRERRLGTVDPGRDRTPGSEGMYAEQRLCSKARKKVINDALRAGYMCLSVKVCRCVCMCMCACVSG